MKRSRQPLTQPPSTPLPSSLGHVPTDRWKFDESVALVFEDMLKRSIPQIDEMRDLVFQTATRFVLPRTDIVDLGCARGDAMAPLIEKYSRGNHFVGIEVSSAMLTECRRRFKSMLDSGLVEIRGDDLRTCYPDVKASVTLCVLTLQFIPIEYRPRVLANAFAHTVEGGILLLIEKVIGTDAQTDKLFVDLYHAHKRSMGYSQEEIDRKRLSLEGVLVPVTAAWNEDLLRGAGFKHVECFWRFLNFCGWIAQRTDS